MALFSAADATPMKHKRPRPSRRGCSSSGIFLSIYAVFATISLVQSRETATVTDEDYGNHNLNWEDGPSSWEEFGHDNDPSVCGLKFITVEEWEAGRYWERGQPVIVKNVTDRWAARHNWKLSEMLERYPDAEATMGDGRRVGEIGPDGAGNLLTHTTVKEFITKHMYDPDKYFFDRKIAIPKGMLEDCHPFPMPTRAFLEDPLADGIYAPSKKKKVDPRPDGTLWMDHLAIAIGSDLQGLSFHFHGAAWNTVIFGTKRWILYDPKRWQNNEDDKTLQRRVALATDAEWATILSTPEWIRQLYPDPFRKNEIRSYGHDCIQHAGDMMYVPHQWMHMVVNIGDTVSVISEVGLDAGEGKKPEDFAFDPFESSSSEDWSSSEDGDGPPEWYRRGPPPGYYEDSEDGDGPPEWYRRGPPPGYYEDSEDGDGPPEWYGRGPPPGYFGSSDDDSEDS